MKVYSVLSEDDSLTKEATKRDFNYSAFFWNIVAFFEDPDFTEEATETLEWWNQYVIFNAYSYTVLMLFIRQIFPKQSTPNSTESRPSRLAQMKSRRDAHKAAAAAALTAQDGETPTEQQPYGDGSEGPPEGNEQGGSDTGNVEG